MESGHHVYTEKAPALDLAQCRLLRETQRRTGKVYMTALKKRFAPAYTKAKAVISADQFGAPALLTITRTSGQWRGQDDTVNTNLRENSIYTLPAPHQPNTLTAKEKHMVLWRWEDRRRSRVLNAWGILSWELI